jgi:hypothetical protein
LIESKQPVEKDRMTTLPLDFKKIVLPHPLGTKDIARFATKKEATELAKSLGGTYSPLKINFGLFIEWACTNGEQNIWLKNNTPAHYRKSQEAWKLQWEYRKYRPLLKGSIQFRSEYYYHELEALADIEKYINELDSRLKHYAYTNLIAWNTKGNCVFNDSQGDSTGNKS